MAATVLTPAQTDIRRGVVRTVVTIPTTVDATDGATCDFQLTRAFSVTIQSVCANYNAKTIELRASCDNTNFKALPTAKTFTADGILSVAAIDCGYCFYRVNITGAPIAIATVTVIANQLGS